MSGINKGNAGKVGPAEALVLPLNVEGVGVKMTWKKNKS